MHEEGIASNSIRKRQFTGTKRPVFKSITWQKENAKSETIMNQTQQEIFAFHKRITPLLQAVFAQYGPRNTPKIYRTVLQPCRRLLQKCSCKSVMDTSRYCTLAYWLYIFGNRQAALALCEAVHGVEFPFEFGHWQGGIQNIYGLEIRIARELFGEDRRKILPPALLDCFCSKSVKKAMRWPQVMPDQTTPEQTAPERAQAAGASLSACGDPLHEAEMLRVLRSLIGHGETGLFPELERHREEIEQTIRLCLERLQLPDAPAGQGAPDGSGAPGASEPSRKIE